MATRGAAVVAMVAWACADGFVLQASERPAATAGITAGLEAAGRDGRQRALDALPLDRMDAAGQRAVDHFRRSTTLHRRLPAETIRCDRELLEFVLAKPETLVDVWRVLGISRVCLDPTAAGQWRLSDGYGTVGSVALLHRERTTAGGLWVFLGRGGYTGPLAARDLTGSCLVVVRHETVADGDEAPVQRLQLEAFLDVDGLGLEIVTRSLQPLIVHSATVNVREICLFVSQFAAAADRNPAGVARLTERLARTPPADRRMLARLAAGDSLPHDSLTADGEAVREELAARWLPAEALEATRR